MSTSASGGEVFAAPYVVEHTFRRSLGPVMSRFLTGLRDRRIEGIRTTVSLHRRIVEDPAEIRPALERAADSAVPALVNVHIAEQMRMSSVYGF